MRKHATSIILAISAVSLGVYVWIDHRRPTTQEVEARKTNLLSIFRPDDVLAIDITVNHKTASIERKDNPKSGDRDYYFVKEHTNASDAELADQVAVDGLINALERAVILRKLGDEIHEHQVGFDKPTAELSVRTRTASYQISLGGEAVSPVGARYAKLSGISKTQGLFVISKATADELTRPVDAYRSRRVLPYSASELASIQISGDQGLVRIDRGPWGGFRIDNAPGKPRVSRTAFDRVLRGFADSNAEKFLDEAEGRRASEHAKRKVSLVLVPKEGPTAELTIGGACPAGPSQTQANSESPIGEDNTRIDHAETVMFEESTDATLAPRLVVAERKTPSPLYACVPGSALDDIDLPLEFLADRRMLRGFADEIEEVRVTRGDATLDLARKGSGWHVRLPEERDVPAEDVNGFLSALVAVEGTLEPVMHEAQLAAFGVSASLPPRATITVRHPSLNTIEVPPQVVLVGNKIDTEQGARIAVQRKEDGVVLLIPTSASPLFEASLTWIRSTALLQVNALRMKRVEVSLADGWRQSIDRNGPGFSMEEPKGFKPDASLAADLFDAVSSLRAVHWVADRDDGSFGFGVPVSKLHLEFEGEHGEERRTLLLGSETMDGRYGRWEVDDGVFVLPRAFDAVTRTYAIDRFVFMVDPSEIGSIKLRSGGKYAEFRATNDGFHFVGGSMLSVSDEMSLRVREVLGELRAEGVVHVGGPRKDEGLDDSVSPLLSIDVALSTGSRQSRKLITIGRGDVWRTTSVYYARVGGVDATYVVAQSRVRYLLEMMGVL